MENLNKLLKVLVDEKIDFVVVGGFAAVLHGASQITFDLDVCLLMTQETIQRLKKSLAPHNPVHRQTAKKPSFLKTPENTRGIRNLYLNTDIGTLDVLSEITAVGGYNQVLQNAVEIELFGAKIKVIGLDDLIKSKKAMGRPKDVATMLELNTIKEKKKKRP